MEGSEPMGAWGSGTTFCGMPGNACFVFAFVSTITSELGLEEMQLERLAANKQIMPIFNLRSIPETASYLRTEEFPAAGNSPPRLGPSQPDYFSDSASKCTSSSFHNAAMVWLP